MRIEQLYHLIEVAKMQSFTIAAQNLFISQPTISESIKKLEKELDITLFHRQKNSVTLTELGQEIYDIALQIVSQFERIQAISHKEALNVNNTWQGHLRISVSTGVIQGCLNNVLPLFRSLYPNITLSVIEYAVYDVLDSVRAQECDIALIVVDQNKYWQEESANLKYRCLFTEDFYALVPVGSALADKNNISVRELLNYPIASMSYNHMISLNDMFDDESSFQTVFATNDLRLLEDFVVRNNVIGFPLSTSLLSALSGNMRVKAVKISSNFKAKIYYLYHADNPKKDLIGLFVEILENEFIR